MQSPIAISLMFGALVLSLPAQAELSPGQIAAATQVYVGDANCELKQSVNVSAVAGKPGYFELKFKKARYLLVPQETTTGAVRLEDRAAGIVWIQIPAKSMMLNTKLGQRVVDGCMHSEQVAESATAPSSANTMGLAPTR